MRPSPARVPTFFLLVFLFLALSAQASNIGHRTFDSRAPAALHKRTFANHNARLAHRQAANPDGDGDGNDGNNGDTQDSPPEGSSSSASSSTPSVSSTRSSSVRPSTSSTRVLSSSTRPRPTSSSESLSSSSTSTSSALPSSSSSSSTRSSTTSSSTRTSLTLSSTSTKTSSSLVTSSSAASSALTSSASSTALALGPLVVTRSSTPTTVLSTPTSVPSSTETAASDSSSATGFFANTPAVAGTFTAVGLVGVAAVGYLVLLIVRKRRSRETDDAFFEKYSHDVPPPAQHNDHADVDVTSDPDAGHYAQPAPADAYPDREIHYGQAVLQAGTNLGYPAQAYTNNTIYTPTAYGIEYPPGTRYQDGAHDPFVDDPQATQYAGVGAGAYGERVEHTAHETQRVSPMSSSGHPFADPSNASQGQNAVPPVRYPQGGPRTGSNAEYAPSVDSFYGPSTPN